MAIRGIAATLDFYPKDYSDSALDVLYSYQNHFPGARTIGTDTYDYNSFSVGSITESQGSNAPSVKIDFIATAANVDLIEEAIENYYAVAILIWRWGFTENIDDPGPGDFNLYAAYIGNALMASSDYTTVSLTVAEYNNSQAPDLPWRKIPWTILGPLSFRR